MENQLKRRFDLIPNLVETVKGYAAQKRAVFLGVAEPGSLFPGRGRGRKGEGRRGELEGAISRLLLLQELYPELKSNENFLKLQDSLGAPRNRIAVVERKRYNDLARELNTYIKTFPGMFFAKWAGVKEAQYFEARRRSRSPAGEVLAGLYLLQEAGGQPGRTAFRRVRGRVPTKEPPFAWRAWMPT